MTSPHPNSSKFAHVNWQSSGSCASSSWSLVSVAWWAAPSPTAASVSWVKPWRSGSGWPFWPPSSVTWLSGGWTGWVLNNKNIGREIQCQENYRKQVRKLWELIMCHNFADNNAATKELSKPWKEPIVNLKQNRWGTKGQSEDTWSHKGPASLRCFFTLRSGVGLPWQSAEHSRPFPSWAVASHRWILWPGVISTFSIFRLHISAAQVWHQDLGTVVWPQALWSCRN